MATINVPEKKYVGVYPRKRNGKIVGYFARGHRYGHPIALGQRKDYFDAVNLRLDWEKKRDTEKTRIAAANLHKSNNTVKNELSELISDFTLLNIKSTPVAEWKDWQFLKYFNELYMEVFDKRGYLQSDEHYAASLIALNNLQKRRPIFNDNAVFKTYIEWAFSYVLSSDNTCDGISIKLMTNNFMYTNFKWRKDNWLSSIHLL